MSNSIERSYWREDDDALAVSINNTVTYYSSDDSIIDVAADLGLTRDDFDYISLY